MRLLCLGGLHGHLAALAAVLASAERHGYDRILVAGDLCFPGPQPLETWRRLAALGATVVRGATDVALGALDGAELRARDAAGRARLARFREVQRELGPSVLGRLRELPDAVRVPLPDGRELLLVHGSPIDPLEPIAPDASDEEVSALVGDDPADVVVCGASTVPFERVVGDVRVVGVGAVSRPGDEPWADATLLEIDPRRAFAAVGAGALRVTRLRVPLRDRLEGAA